MKGSTRRHKDRSGRHLTFNDGLLGKQKPGRLAALYHLGALQLIRPRLLAAHMNCHRIGGLNRDSIGLLRDPIEGRCQDAELRNR